MIKVKFNERKKQPIRTQSKIDGFGISSPYSSPGGLGEPDRVTSGEYDPRYALAGMEEEELEECGCGCDSCMSGEEQPEEIFVLDDEMLYEKKDRCYHLAKRKYKVFPSAYASGFIVRCRKGKVAKKKNEELELDESTFDKEKSQGLHGWFARQGGKGKSKGWVDCNTCRTNPETGRKQCKTCGRQSGEKRGKYPACRPTPSACTRSGTSKKKSSTRVSWKSKKEEEE